MLSGIYCILNITNTKVYVGQAFYFYKRWKNHRIALQYGKHHNRYLQAAYDKNGQFAFIYVVLEYCDTDKLTEREQYWIYELKSADREYGYNLSPIAGGSNLGLKHTDKTKEAWSVQRKGKKRSEAAKAAIKAGWEKRRAAGPVSEETKQRLSDAHKGKKHTAEFKISAAERMKGNQINTGRKQSTEEIEVRRWKNFGKKRTPEQIANVLEAKRVAAKRREKDLMWAW